MIRDYIERGANFLKRKYKEYVAGGQQGSMLLGLSPAFAYGTPAASVASNGGGFSFTPGIGRSKRRVTTNRMRRSRLDRRLHNVRGSHPAI